MELYEILCYGDSNTWGTVARCNTEDDEFRYDRLTRWPCVLQSELGSEYAVTEEGMGFRTTVYTNDAEKPWQNGLNLLEPVLHSHHPLDMVIVMLGTNDLRQPKLPEAEELQNGISRIVEFIRQHPEYGRNGNPPKIIIISPPFITPSRPDGRTEVYPLFHGAEGEALSRQFPEEYRRTAQKYGCGFVNSQKLTVPDSADGVHIDAPSHIRLAKAVAEEVKRLRFID